MIDFDDYDELEDYPEECHCRCAACQRGAHHACTSIERCDDGSEEAE